MTIIDYYYYWLTDITVTNIGQLIISVKFFIIEKCFHWY